MDKADSPLVVGLGNTLMGDDGIGVTVSRNLRVRGTLAAQVAEAGTPGFSLIDLLTQDRPVIFIDAVDGGHAAGFVFPVNPAEILNETTRHSLHQITLADVLALLDKTKARFNIKIIGIQPERIGPGPELSPALESRLPEIVAAVESRVNEALAVGLGENNVGV